MGLYAPPPDANQILLATKISDQFWKVFLIVFGSLLDSMFEDVLSFVHDFPSIKFLLICLDFGMVLGIILDVLLIPLPFAHATG